LEEGIFDYFAFYNLLQDQDKPVVVSTGQRHQRVFLKHLKADARSARKR
jgi:hypothetical protein